MRRRLSVSRHAVRRVDQSNINRSIAAMPRPLVLVLVFFLLGGAIAAAGEDHPDSVLANSPGLEKRITYSETKIPLGELVARVAADTGVPLTAARDVADEPVVVVVKEFPARELLEQLAALLDYQWSRRGRGKGAREQGGEAGGVGLIPGEGATKARGLTPKEGRKPVFEIWQDLASKQREEALRHALDARLGQRVQEEMAICRELSGKSQEEMRRLWDEATRWNEQLQKRPPEERQALLNSPEVHQLKERRFYVWYLWSPIQRSLAGWMTRLSPEQWAALRAGRHLVFSSHPLGSKLPLPPDVLRSFRTSRPAVSPPGQAVPPGFFGSEEEARRQEREQQERWDQADQYDVVLRLLASGNSWWDPASIQLGAFTQPFRAGERLGQQDANPNFYLLVDAAQAAPLTEEDPERRSRLERDPVLSVRKPFQADTRPIVDPLFPGASRTVRLLPEYLPELARVYGVDIIADSYWSTPRVFDGPSTSGPRPLFEVLDSLTELRFNWDRRGSLVRIRDRQWFLDRPREIPLRQVRRWVALTDRLGALPLEEFVSAATALTDLQVDTLEGLFGTGIFPPQLNDLRGLSGSLSLLRLHARLSSAQRRALEAGQPLATAQLSSALRPFVLAQLRRANRYRIPMPGFEEWGGGHLSVFRTPDVRIREQRGRSVTWRLESAPAPSSTARPDEVTRFPVTHLEMRIHDGAQKSHALRLIVAGRLVPLE